MNISEIIQKRESIDQELDGFSDFVDVRRMGNLRIVHRDAKPWLGIIDDRENILLPLVYDAIELMNWGYELTISDGENRQHKGLADNTGAHLIIPVNFKAFYPIDGTDKYWCLDHNGSWHLYGTKDERLPADAIPLDCESQVCVLRKKRSNSYAVECWNENGNSSQMLMRSLALDSEVPNRIVFRNCYYNLVVYCDIYGNVLDSNFSLQSFFEH